MRVDSGVEAGSEVTPMYDPMFAKLIVWDLDREKATARMLRALGEYEIGGITTLVPFHQALLATKQWANGETCRDLTEDPKWLKSLAPEAAAAPGGDEAAADGKAERSYQVEVGGKLFDVKVIGEAAPRQPRRRIAGAGLRKPPRRERGRRRRRPPRAAARTWPHRSRATVCGSPVEEGQEVSEGDLICVIEAMKMENEITAHSVGQDHQAADLGGRLGQHRGPAREDRIDGSAARPCISSTWRRASPRPRGGS